MKRLIVALLFAFVFLWTQAEPVSATVETGWPAGKTNVCKKPTDGFVDFEDGTNGEIISSSIPGLKFSTTYGIDWRYGDKHFYNVYPYGSQAYETNGDFFAWLGVTGNVGRIDFTKGNASYLSVLTSTYSGLVLDAYDANDNLLASSGWAGNNVWTRTFTRLTVEAPNMAYVLIHDAGNYWLIDDLCTNASGVPPVYDQVADLAKQIIGAIYLWGGKGYNFHGSYFVEPYEILQDGYYYYNPNKPGVESGKGIDCSGLVLWSYNRTYSGGKISWKTCMTEKKCPIYLEGADGQYRYNTQRILKEELRPGDLLFFSTKTAGVMDHVAMYVGPYTYGGKTYNAVHASGFASKTTPAVYNLEKGELQTVKPSGSQQNLKVTAYGRVAEFTIAMEVKSKSPIHLVVADPDGLVVTKENMMLDEDGYTQEVPGMYYTVREEDGELNDTVIIPELKIGNYIIKVVPKAEALQSDTYGLEVIVNEEKIVLAENVLISDIPSQGYGITSTEEGIYSFIPLTIDIKPGSIPNCIQVKNKGVLPVAILGSNGFNVKKINISTVEIDDDSEIATRGNSPVKTAIKDLNGDLIPDLILHFDTQQLKKSGLLIDGNTLFITGKLIDDKIFLGSDVINLSGKPSCF